MAGDERDDLRAKQGRLAALVIAVTGVLWVIAGAAASHWHWPVRFRALMDLLALGGFLFALMVTFRIWRDRQKDEGK